METKVLRIGEAMWEMKSEQLIHLNLETKLQILES